MPTPLLHRPHTTLGRVLDELGATLLQHACGPLVSDRRIEDVVIEDPVDTEGAGADDVRLDSAGTGGAQVPDADAQGAGAAIVLGVGLRGSDAIRSAAARLGVQGAAALVVRAPFEPDAACVRAAEAAGLAVLTLAPGAAWAHLAKTLTALMVAENADGSARATFGGIQAGDLFAVANSIAALLESPVTIEDRHSRVLAFSSRQEEADASRVQTILGRQVPAQYTEFLESQGVFQELFGSDRPVYVAPLPEEAGAGPEEQARTAIAVRAGGEILGTIWVAAAERLTPERELTLIECSRLVAMHLVWQRTDADAEHRLRAELLETALSEGSGATEALRRLELRDEPAVVIALTLLDPATERIGIAHVAAERKRVADAFTMHLSFTHPRALSGLIDDTVYGVLPLIAVERASTDNISRITENFLARVKSPLSPIVGIGRVAHGTRDLAYSRQCADRALRVLRTAASGRRIASFDEVHADALLIELPVPTSDFPSGVIARLAAYDREHQSTLVDTLGAWLDAFGDVALAAAAMHVHANTFRYRLRRVVEVGGIDLDDPDARFAAMLQLRLLALAR